MQFVKQRIRLPIDSVGDNNLMSNDSKKKKFKHSPLFNDNLRMIICGRSGSGKTQAAMSLLYHSNGLKFENVYIYCKSLFQPKYVVLKKVLDSVKGINCYLFSNNDDVIPPNEIQKNSVFIMDDVVFSKQDRIKLYFCMGRHRNIDIIYISQSYAAIPKHLIRENANFAVLFKQDDMNLKHVFDDFGISMDMTFDQFKKMCVKCWNEKYAFLSIDLEREMSDGKYRLNFDTFINLN